MLPNPSGTRTAFCGSYSAMVDVAEAGRGPARLRARASWWRSGVIYQIYPRSFQDSNNDGVGDLAGIERRLDYLCWLGIDAIWISPFYPSPMVDFGYDVADYCNVDPVFGTLGDFDRLLAAAHKRGLKLILDFVPNHTSDQHPWFMESRTSRDNSKRDWYLWRDPASDGGPPNNWISDFGGSAWAWDERTGQYYYHAFLPQQPDLNWRNPQVRATMAEMMRFWLERGVDGFRVDVIWHLIKHADFIDNPLNPEFKPRMGEMHRVLQTHSTDQPEVHALIAEFRAVVDEYEDRVLLGEIYLPIDRLMAYYGGGRSIHLPLNFHLISAPWRAPALAELIAAYEAALPLGAWPNWVIGNHDRPRIATRAGERGARLAAMLMLTLRGTPTLYYGDELGLADTPISPDAARDPRELREPGLGLGRDPVRTPMLWSQEPHAGFSTAAPWLPLSLDAASRNVELLREDSRSILSLYRALLRRRRDSPALSLGDITLLQCDEDVLIYERCFGEERLRIALNFGAARPAPAEIAGLQLLLTTEMDRNGKTVRDLRAQEAVLCVAGKD